MSTDSSDVSQNQLFSAKEAHRRALASKSVEEKLAILIQLQQLASTVARETGRSYREPWKLQVPKKRLDA
jgi:hypothetical protein